MMGRWQTTAAMKAYDPPAEPRELPWPVAVQVLSAGGAQLISSVAVLVLGWALSETSGTAAARADLWNGRDGSGKRVASIGMLAGGGSAVAIPRPGIPAPDGLYLSVGAGAFNGAIWVQPVPGGIPLPDADYSLWPGMKGGWT